MLTTKARIVNQNLNLKDIQDMLKERYRINASIPEISESINERRTYQKYIDILAAVKELLTEMENQK